MVADLTLINDNETWSGNVGFSISLFKIFLFSSTKNDLGFSNLYPFKPHNYLTNEKYIIFYRLITIRWTFFHFFSFITYYKIFCSNELKIKDFQPCWPLTCRVIKKKITVFVILIFFTVLYNFDDGITIGKLFLISFLLYCVSNYSPFLNSKNQKFGFMAP